jgi:predicted RNA-binding protein with PUA domain
LKRHGTISNKSQTCAVRGGGRSSYEMTQPAQRRNGFPVDLLASHLLHGRLGSARLS